jgi:menaquinol-cytochrome c reductase iron-sulfur subunit
VTHETDKPDHAPTVGRRDLLSTIGFWIASAASVLVLGIPSVRFAVGKSLDKATEQWVPLGSPDKLAAGDFTPVVYQFRTKDAWREVTKEGVIYVQPTSGAGAAAFTALSAVCTHLGCNVRWSKAASHFTCPCHQGIYDSQGAVISGPPPRPLRQLETRIQDGVLQAHL